MCSTCFTALDAAMANGALIGGAALEMWNRARRGPGAGHRREAWLANARFLRDIGLDPMASLGPAPADHARAGPSHQPITRSLPRDDTTRRGAFDHALEMGWLTSRGAGPEASLALGRTAPPEAAGTGTGAATSDQAASAPERTGRGPQPSSATAAGTKRAPGVFDEFENLNTSPRARHHHRRRTSSRQSTPARQRQLITKRDPADTAPEASRRGPPGMHRGREAPLIRSAASAARVRLTNPGLSTAPTAHQGG